MAPACVYVACIVYLTASVSGQRHEVVCNFRHMVPLFVPFVWMQPNEIVFLGSLTVVHLFVCFFYCFVFVLFFLVKTV